MNVSSTNSLNLLNTISSPSATQTTQGITQSAAPSDSADISQRANLLSKELTDELDSALPSLLQAQTSTAILGTLGGDANTSLLESATFAEANSILAKANAGSGLGNSNNASLLNLLG